MGTSPDRIRADIKATRDRLAGDLDRLAERASPRRRGAGPGKGRLRGAVCGLQGLRARLRGRGGAKAHR